MKLSDILTPLRKEIDEDDAVREKALPLGRKAVRKCSESIKMTHRGEFDRAKTLISEAHQIIVEASKELSDSEFMMRSRGLDVAHQELAEAVNLLSLMENGTFTVPAEYNIPARSYLNGLADTIGELRRASLDLLRNDNEEKAEPLRIFTGDDLTAISQNKKPFDWAPGLLELTKQPVIEPDFGLHV